MTLQLGQEEKKILTNLVWGKELQSTLRKRNSKYLYKTVKRGNEGLLLQDGWEVSRKNKKSVRLQKSKPIDEVFEDEVWRLFAKMDFKEMNKGRDFKIPVTDGPYEIPPKQIDVFAIDEETVIFVECKASESPTKRSLQKDINEISGLKRKLMNSVNKHYSPENKLKGAWIFATQNIIWSKPDLERAEEERIIVLRDNGIAYYNELVNHLGPAAKYQLLAELFGHTEIPGLNTTVPAVNGEMGGKSYYSFVIEPSRLLKIAFICHRAKMDEGALASYQRMLKKSRLNSIHEYIENNNGLFPTNIVVNIVTDNNKPLRFDPVSPKDELGVKFGTLYLPNTYKSAWIIDGQHRLYGFSRSSYAAKVKLPVIAFENMSGHDQAKMFVDINSTQVRVPTNLLTELYSDLLWDSKREDEKLLALTSRLVLFLDKDLTSPLKDKIIYSGKKKDKRRPITNTTLNTAIEENNLLGHVPRGSNQLYPGPFYVKDMETALDRAKEIISAYLKVFVGDMAYHWDIGSSQGGYLCTNNGISALMIVLRNILDHMEKKSSIRCNEMPTEELIQELLPFAKALSKHFKVLSPEEIRRYRDQLGAHGQKRSAYGMMEMINQEFPDFKPPGLEEYIASKSTEFTSKARAIVPETQLLISNYVISKLKEKHGEENKKWWFEGIPEPVRTKAAVREQEDPEHKPQEKQLDLIDYKDIASKNWEMFKDAFSPEQNMSKANALKWFDDLNKIRNKVSHPERGQVTEEEYTFLLKIDKTAKERFHLGAPL